MKLNIEHILKMFGEYTYKAILLILGLILTYILARFACSVVLTATKKARLDPSLQKFASKIIKWVVIVLGMVTCLGQAGIQTTSFAAVIAAAGFAVGMALQGTLGHFAAGVCLLVLRPFKVGDFVTISGTSGTVDTIDVFNTALDTPDNKRVIIPNGAVFSATIENVTYHPRRRVEVVVGTDYEADIEKTRTVLINAALSVEKGLGDPAPAVVLTGLGASSVDWAVRLWVETGDFGTVKDELTEKIKLALDQAKIAIPYPQMHLHVNSEEKLLN